MKKSAFAVLAVLPLLASAVPSSDERELLAVRRSAWDAWFAGDTRTLATLLPEDALVVSPGDATWKTRAESLADSKKFHEDGGKLLSLEFPLTEVRHYGTTAIVFSTYRYELESGGKKTANEGKCTEVFVKQGGRWIHPTWTLVRTATGS
jgi:ketosteroid isomerase-like protein